MKIAFKKDGKNVEREHESQKYLITSEIVFKKLHFIRIHLSKSDNKKSGKKNHVKEQKKCFQESESWFSF